MRAARAGQSALAQADRPTAWVAPVLSLIVTGGFFALLFVLIYKKDLNWSNSVLQIVNISVGALAAAFATVMNFWFGSSLSSRNKDAMVADLQSRQTAQTADVLRQATAVVTGGHVSAFDKARPAPPPASVDGNGDFAICLAFVLHAEGGFVDNPADPGGATNFGITLRTLEAWRRAPVTVADVRSLTEVEAAEIYRANYWDAMRCDRLPKGVDLMVFDFGVNAGPRRSILVLQTAAGAAADGVIGPATLAAVGAASPRELIMKLATLRMDFYRSLPTWGTFGSGWSNRVEAAQRKALAMLG